MREFLRKWLGISKFNKAAEKVIQESVAKEISVLEKDIKMYIRRELQGAIEQLFNGSTNITFGPLWYTEEYDEVMRRFSLSIRAHIEEVSSAEIRRYVKSQIEPELFIDNIVKRIKNKQLD